MNSLKSLYAVVDFSAPYTLQEMGHRLSTILFGGIEFTGLDEGILDEIPAMRLDRDFMGLRVVLGGKQETGYTLEIETTNFPWDQVPTDNALSVVCDISGLLAFQLGNIEGVEIDPEWCKNSNGVRSE